MAKAKKERFIITTRWRNLTPEEQVEEVRHAMHNRHTNKTAARALGTTPGIVAGIRYRHDIAPREIPAPKGGKPLKKPPQKRAQAKLAPAVAEPPPAPAPALLSPGAEEVVAVEGPVRKMAPQGEECSYMDEDKMRCACLPMEPYPLRPELDLDRCKLHQRKR